MAITLPKKPTDEGYEDFVAAWFQASGFFIETNLTLVHEKVEILELDIVATPLTESLKSTLLIEAKSGSTGFADLFKVYGWMQYLDMKTGYLFRTKAPEDSKMVALSKVSKELGVNIVICDPSNFDSLESLPEVIKIPAATFSAILSSAWYSRIAQRMALRKYYDFCNSNKGVACVQEARSYRWKVQEAFFAPRPIKRAGLLYEAYKTFPKLSGQILEHLAKARGGALADENEKVRDTSERLGVQYVMMLEHTARLGILKNAIIRGIENDGATADPKKLLAELLMPTSFKKSIKFLQKHPYRDRIPYLIQVFIEVFGGFFGKDGDDLKAMGECTGIPANEVEGCLRLFDELFPMSSSWFFDVKDELCLMKAVPAVYRGAGSFLRGDLYKIKSYEEKYPKMGWLLNKWHRAIYETLEPILATTEKSA